MPCSGSSLVFNVFGPGGFRVAFNSVINFEDLLAAVSCRYIRVSVLSSWMRSMSIEADKKPNSCRYLFSKLKKIKNKEKENFFSSMCRLKQRLSIICEDYLKGRPHDAMCDCHLS